MKTIIRWIKKEIVLCIAILLAVVSSFVVHPDSSFSSYIDWRVLAILFCLMLVMEGFKSTGFFSSLGRRLIKRTRNTFELECVLVFMCFFASMIMTNDVALITFVPFTLLIFAMCNMESRALMVVILQTVAANLGSMLTPIGNPQNLYLFGKMGISVFGFIKIMLPYTLASAAVLFMFLLFRRKEPVSISDTDAPDKRSIFPNIIYGMLFIICLLIVFGVVSYIPVLVVVLAVFLIVNRRLILKVDYSLLFTFVGFFVFIGNIRRIDAVHAWMESMISGRELIFSIVSSQIVSNVPAALLISGFSDNYRNILIGVNIGGLGTLIASMASLISYKLFCNSNPKKKGRYLGVFTLTNIAFLIILVILSFICR